MAEKLTSVSVRNLKPREKKLEVMDEANPGFGVWVYPSGRKAFFYAYRCQGRKGRVTLDHDGLADAREQYSELRALVRKGIDPQQQRAEEKREQELDLTFGQLAQRYLDEYASRKRSGAEDKRLLDFDVLPRFQRIKAKDIRRRDIQEMLKAIVDRGAQTTANRTFAVTRRVFNWGIEQDLIENTPCAGVSAPSKEQSSNRVLTEAEIAAFWNLKGLSVTVHSLLKLQLQLGQRIGELLGMRWGELDLGGEKLWTLPPERTKNGTLHLVPLPTSSIEIIEAMAPLSEDSELVFPSQRRRGSVKQGRAGESATYHPIRVDSIGTALTRAITPTDIAHFSSHDLRRTAATQISALGYTDDLIGRILNHVNRTVTARYNRYAYLPEKREALERWAVRLEEIVRRDLADQPRR